MAPLTATALILFICMSLLIPNANKSYTRYDFGENAFTPQSRVCSNTFELFCVKPFTVTVVAQASTIVGGTFGTNAIHPEVVLVVTSAAHVIDGAVTSCTVTIAVPVPVLPLASVTVSVTVFGPTLAQVNVFGDTVIEAIPQTAVEPLST